MSKREVPKLNKENFPTWKSFMRLHLARIGDGAIHFVDNKYVEITTIPLTTQQMKEAGS